ncbi:TPA: helix-turn-helix transcriptional regulator [Escherichia coli]|uniref:AraC family transcriptional regulator n=1 Tax=Escherichia coli TaxID=562 RepID=UPI0022552F2E|nr:AraC family transcriptional regulator [Escherichia coli]MCX3719423.1 helix-turn-helix transcriptional regulator [Escherichia coli]
MSLGLGSDIATGITDEHHGESCDKIVESPLPFFYLLYAMDKKFSVSISGKRVECFKDQCVFIKKSVPFSVILGWDNHGLKRTDIFVVRFKSAEISNFNLLYDRQFERLQKLTTLNSEANDFYFFDFSYKEKNELETFRWMVSQVANNNITYKTSPPEKTIPLNNVKSHFLLAYLLDNNSDIEKMFHDNSSSTLSEKVASLIISDYTTNWTNNRLASKFSMSESSFKKKMYEEVGTISDFIHKIKLTEALRRLRRTNDSIGEIAEALGYCSSSYFASIFKKHFKISPADIRVIQNK